MKFNTLYSAMWEDDCYPFHVLGKEKQVARTPDQLTDVNSALIVWGGSDIDPAFYNHPSSRRTYNHPTRDNAEWALMARAVNMGITIIGVCRGAQMLCAAAGGFLLQHVENHHGYHAVNTKDGDKFSVNSIHHQMMAGFEKVDHELLCWSDVKLSPEYIYKADEMFKVPDNWVEPEYVLFPKIKGHAIQWHPEMMDENSRATQYVLNVINNNF